LHEAALGKPTASTKEGLPDFEFVDFRNAPEPDLTPTST
jgi:hypothetical protein